MAKPVEVRPTTTSRAAMPLAAGTAQRRRRMDRAGPGLVVRVDHERIDLEPVASAYNIG